MATRQRQRTERTRLAFLKAARDLLLDQGYAATSVADIVRRAGRAHGTFYLYFDNKHDVFAALLTQLVTRVVNDTSRPMPAPRGNITKAEHVVTELAHLVDANEDLWRLIEEMSATDSTAISARLQVRESLEAWFLAGWRTAADPNASNDSALTLLAELVTGSLIWRARPGRQTATTEIIRTSSQILSAAWERSEGRDH